MATGFAFDFDIDVTLVYVIIDVGPPVSACTDSDRIQSAHHLNR